MELVFALDDVVTEAGSAGCTTDVVDIEETSVVEEPSGTTIEGDDVVESDVVAGAIVVDDTPAWPTAIVVSVAVELRLLVEDVDDDSTMDVDGADEADDPDEVDRVAKVDKIDEVELDSDDTGCNVADISAGAVLACTINPIGH